MTVESTENTYRLFGAYYLSPLSENDTNEIFRAMNNIDVTQDLLTLPSPYTRDMAVEFATKTAQKKYTDDKTALYYGIRDKNKLNEYSSDLIGVIEIRPSDCVPDQEKYLPDPTIKERYARFGFWLDPAYHRQGIMSSALEIMIEQVGKKVMGINLYYGDFFAHNQKSKGTFQKVGFKYVVTKIQAVQKVGTEQKLDLSIMELRTD